MKKYLFISAVVLAVAAAATLYAAKDNQKRTARKEQASERRQERIKKREARTAEFVKYMDSVILSHEYVFNPSSFQRQPAGRTQQIINPNFEIIVGEDYYDFYIPYVKGVTPPYRVALLNNITSFVNGYTAIQTDNGWTIRFNTALFGPDTYNFEFNIYSSTGSATLDISNPFENTVSYWGSITGRY